jgi:hypothetical protein
MIVVGHVVSLHLLQYNIFGTAKFQLPVQFSERVSCEGLKQQLVDASGDLVGRDPADGVVGVAPYDGSTIAQGDKQKQRQDQRGDGNWKADLNEF